MQAHTLWSIIAKFVCMSLKMCHFQYCDCTILFRGTYQGTYTYKYVKDILVWWSIQPTSHSMLKTVTRTIRGGQPCELTNNVYINMYICTYIQTLTANTLWALVWTEIITRNNFNLFFAVSHYFDENLCIPKEHLHMCRRHTNWQQNVHICMYTLRIWNEYK